MAKAAALVITGISIALLVIYGADVAAAVNVDGEVGEQGDGFLQMDHMTRGLGLELGSTDLIHKTVMCNILGSDGFEGKYKPVQLEKLAESIGYRTASLKMYGKSISNPQRKLGHFNIVDRNDLESIDQLLKIADKIKNSISITPLD